MNSFLQALFMIKDFKSSLLLFSSPSSSSLPLLFNIQELFQILSRGKKEEERGGWKSQEEEREGKGRKKEEEGYKSGNKIEEIGKKDAFSMQKFKESLPEPFDKSLEQQDAMEFGRIFLDKMEEIFKGSKNDVTNFLFNKK